jgi:hypothetical protein
VAEFKSIAAFEKTLREAQADFERNTHAEIVQAQAERGKDIVQQEARADLGGDGAMSGFKRGNPIEAAGTVRMVRGGRAALLLPASRGAAAAITIATTGRNRGNASGFSGPALNHRTGVTSRNKRTGNLIRRRTTRRQWNGYTDPKGTADRAVARMKTETADIAEKRQRRALQTRFDVD